MRQGGSNTQKRYFVDPGVEQMKYTVSIAAWTVLALSMASVTVLAQEVGTAPGSDEANVSEVVVTGSRIARSNADSSTPLQVLGADVLEDEAEANLGDILNELPAFNNAAFTSANATGGRQSGVTGINLRGLGENRTLVLVNGRRYVSGIQSQSVVDIATIPTPLLERVEVSTGGASAVYGSDAIGGVVNLITRKTFDGVQFTSQYGETAEGDRQSRTFGILGGSSFGEKASALGYAGYSEDGAAFSRDRDFSNFDVLLGNAALPQNALLGPAAGSPVTGRTTIFFPNSSTASASAIRTVVLPDGTVAPYNIARDGLQMADYRMLAMPATRYLLAGNLGYDFTDSTRFFLETNFARVDTDSQIQPTFIRSGSTANIGGASPTAIPFTVPVNNPFIPAQILAQVPMGRTEFGIGRYVHELGPRSYEHRRTTYRAVAGVEGEFAAPFTSGTWRWDASLNYGQTNAFEREPSLAHVERLYQAVRVEPNGAGGYQCVERAARAAGCIPINLFTGQSLTPAEIAWMSASVVMDSEVEQKVASASVSGNLFELPAGPLASALGVEWRREESAFTPDSLHSAGLTSGAQQLPISGDYSVREAFVEVRAPVLRDLPMLLAFELEAAFRRANYSTVGAADSWKFGGSYMPIEDLRFRAIRARAIRAPNVSELFNPPTYTGASTLDPCSGGGLTGGLDPETAASRQAYCASLGIGPGFVPPSNIIATYSSGNPDLDAEVSDTLTFGLVYTPGFLRNATLSIDYYDIDIEAAMQGLGVQLLLDQCANSGNPFFCDNVFRDPNTLGLVRVDNVTLNVATRKTTGIDATFAFTQPLARLGGDISFDLNYTTFLDVETQAIATASPSTLRGLSSYPKHRFNLRLGYDRGPWRFALSQRFIGETKRSVDLSFDGNDIPAHLYVDAQIRYTHGERYSFYAGANNVFDKQPPFVPAPYPDNVVGTNTAPSAYDLLGRRFYAGIKVDF
jgi:iron complex outermembrane recepter protein